MAITHVGTAAADFDHNGTASPVDITLTPALPAGVTDDDLIVVHVLFRSPDSSPSISVSGYTKHVDYSPNGGSGSNRYMEVWYKVAGSSESAPDVVISQAPQARVCGAFVTAYRGADTSTPFDLSAAASTDNTGGLTWTPTGLTTATDGAWVASYVATNDDNDLALDSGNEQGFTVRASGASYAYSSANDGCFGLATKEIASAGTNVTCPTWEQTDNGPDQWAGVTYAVRQYVDPTPTGRSTTIDLENRLITVVQGR